MKVFYVHKLWLRPHITLFSYLKVPSHKLIYSKKCGHNGYIDLWNKSVLQNIYFFLIRKIKYLICGVMKLGSLNFKSNFPCRFIEQCKLCPAKLVSNVKKFLQKHGDIVSGMRRIFFLHIVKFLLKKIVKHLYFRNDHFLEKKYFSSWFL